MPFANASAKLLVRHISLSDTDSSEGETDALENHKNTSGKFSRTVPTTSGQGKPPSRVIPTEAAACLDDDTSSEESSCFVVSTPDKEEKGLKHNKASNSTIRSVSECSTQVSCSTMPCGEFELAMYRLSDGHACFAGE
uniref:Uncharacterized protein n=1 Tax=Tetraselmis sp. GSL018 TaxID=582737 RepID=A0A061QVP0_9CHLO